MKRSRLKIKHLGLKRQNLKVYNKQIIFFEGHAERKGNTLLQQDGFKKTPIDTESLETRTLFPTDRGTTHIKYL